jgi:hypothetical protein
MEVDGRSEATGKKVISALSDCRQATELCGEGVGHRLVSSVASALRRYNLSYLLFPSLCSILPAFFWLSRAPFSHSFSSSSSSPSGTVISREQAQIDFSLCPGGNLPPTVLCILTAPSNKAPSHKTDTPISWS